MSEIARHSGLAKSTVTRLAAALLTDGYLARDHLSKRYRLGIRLWELGSLALHRDAVLQAGRRAMRRLAEETEATVVLAVLDGQHVLYIDKMEGTRVVLPRLSERNPAHAVSTGKALLSCLTDAELEKLLPHELAVFTPNTVPDRDSLLRQLKGVRENGNLVVSRGEFRTGIGGIAVPIYDMEGRAAGALGLSCPLVQLTEDVVERYSAAARRAADAVLAGE